MIMLSRTAGWISIALLVACGTARSPDERAERVLSSPAEVDLGPEFQSHIIVVDGGAQRYVRGGAGPAVILLHGFPQDWSTWRHVMPTLAERFTVVAIDLRGIGGTSPRDGGPDAASLAADVHGLARQLDLDRPYIVGQDIGGMVAYAYARAYPSEARGAMILDVPLPGIEPWSEVAREPSLWHFAFHQTPDLPESLVAGREVLYIRDFFDRIGESPGLVGDVDVARYARAYGTPSSLHAAFELYRAFPETERWNESHTGPLDVPIVLAGGDRSLGPILETMASDLRTKGARRVSTEIIAHCGHWVADEQPDQVSALIARHGAP